MSDKAKVVQKVDGEAFAKEAMKIAAQAGAATITALNVMADAKEVTETGTIAILFGLVTDYSQEAIMSWPRMGSEGSNNPDVFSIKVQNRKGEWVNKKTGFYPQWYRGTKDGKAAMEEVANLERLLDDKDNRDGIDAVLMAEYDGDTKKINARVARLTKRIGNTVTAVRKAVRLAHKMNDVNDMLSDVHCEFYTNSKGEVEKTPEPIWVYQIKGYDKDDAPIADPVKQKMFGIGTFLNIDVPKAVEAGGTFEALKKTLQRDTTKKTGDSAAAPQKIATLDTLEARINDVTEYMSVIFSDKTGDALAAFWRKLGGAGSDDLLLNLFSLGDMINDVRRKDKLAARVAALEEKRVGTETMTVEEQEAA